ncbi:hypothetical protein CH306_22965 [Rhodococcus sp. 15-725-2-2b]|uniref:DUF2971 domain-containing protein n=1 Tax=unclassified Rhodococcus (in: high G+C Gram-positive bacteria) TaxID=192944 RepID=UPI000B9AB4BC|nr:MULTISPECIES: DUF2971 domain-containing protein [unclassified Rhodococcus (in: high G+C Gram-positive bacteria)]OZC71749.1 hypothetical protein CH277_04400 [Rhodococcus sp. 06-469-3-2]OZD42538.1 hypothetical protein CH264_21815 [Rhodococcus sp. 06-1477-1A]OZE68245.1 hypothetical protein CH306_22965 [Rhodococcus sp. 15-725-2-2b]
MGDTEPVVKKTIPDLYHYTNVYGLHGILKSNCLWASEVRFLNDKLELKYGLELFKSYMESYYLVSEDETKKKFGRALILHIDQWLEGIEATVDVSVYTACFSEDGDSLSQWRGYTGGNGYSIGFHGEQVEKFTYQFTSAPRRLPDGINFSVKTEDDSEQSKVNKALYPVLYQKHQQHDLANRFVVSFESFLQIVLEMLEGRGLSLENNANDLGNLVFGIVGIDQVAQIKHAGFKDEREWRHVVSSFSEKHNVHYRPTEQFGMVPYIDLNFDPAVAIKSITVGPGVNTEEKVRGLRMLLHSYGFDEIEVEPSCIPFR